MVPWDTTSWLLYRGTVGQLAAVQRYSLLYSGVVGCCTEVQWGSWLLYRGTVYCTEAQSTVQWGSWLLYRGTVYSGAVGKWPIEMAYRGGLLIQFNSQFWQSWRLWSRLRWDIVGGTWRSYRLSYKRHVYIGHQDMDIRSGYGH